MFKSRHSEALPAFLVVIGLILSGQINLGYAGGGAKNNNMFAGWVKKATKEVVQQQRQADALPSDDPQKAAIQKSIQTKLDQTEALVQQDPTNAPLLTAAADQSLQTGDLQKAQARTTQALGNAKPDSPDWAAAMNMHGKIAEQQGDYQTALADAQAILQKFPEDADAIALYHMNKDRVAAAAHDAKANALAKNLSGTMKPSNLNPGQLPPPSTPTPSPYRNPQVELAGQRALARKTGTEFFQKAKASLALGDAEQALKYADSAVKADPSMPDGYFERATAQAVLHQLTRAITDLKTAIELWQGSGQNARLAEAHGLSAKLKNDTGDHKGALDDADKAIGYDPSGAGAYWQRGVAREALGQVQLALADYNKSADLAPEEYGAPRDEAAARLMAPANAGPSAHQQKPGVLSAIARNYKGILGVAGLLLILVAVVSMWASRPDSPVKHITWSTPFRNANGSTSAATVVPEAAAGELVPLNGKYLRGKQIGQGGMGAVYEGHDKDLRRRVAIKCLRPELQSRPRERARFIDEALRVASLHHPHIVEIYDIIQAADATSIVFEYVEGRTLHDELNNNPGRHLEPKRALKYLREIAEALDYAHKHGVIHRDVKPANFMIDEHGRTKVMDFGIARLVLDTMQEMSTNTIVGTPSYMPPEQSMGKISRSLDVYALGVTLYEMLTGALPYRGEDLNARMEGRFLPPSQLLPGLPAAIDDVMKRALDPNPEKRQKTCFQLFEEAAGAFNERPTPA